MSGSGQVGVSRSRKNRPDLLQYFCFVDNFVVVVVVVVVDKMSDISEHNKKLSRRIFRCGTTETNNFYLKH